MSETRTPHVVIVEDAPLHRRMLQSQVKRIFPEAVITEASDLAEARKALQVRVDIAIVDVHLGKENASELLKVFPKGDREFPILMVTADRTPETLNSMFEAGVDDFLTKPLDSMVFEGKVRNLLSGNYLSPLNFFSLKGKVEEAQVRFSVQLYQATEKEVILKTLLMVAKDAELSLSIGGVLIPLKVLENDRETGQDSYFCRCVPLVDTMSEELRSRFRRALLELQERGR